MSTKNSRFSMQLLTIAIALFFIITGLVAITHYNSNMNQMGRAINSFFGGTNQNSTLAMIIAIVELIIGVILLVDVFLPIKENTMSIVKFVIFLLWAVYMVVGYFFNNFMEPDFLSWFQPFTQDLVILTVLWVIKDVRV